MIPVPEAGILRRVEGVPAAGKAPYIEAVVIHLCEGYELVPLSGHDRGRNTNKAPCL